MSETLEFPCPKCHTFLRVPTHLAGITGPCPHCQASITSPSAPLASSDEARKPSQPDPAPATEPAKISSQPPQKTPAKSQPAPPSISYSQERSRKERKLLPSVIFLALLLSLTAGAIYLILDGMGMIGPKDKETTPTPSPAKEDITQPAVPTPGDTQVPVVEPPSPSPAIVIPPSPASSEPSVAEQEPDPEAPKPEPAEIPQSDNLAEPAITPEDISKPGEIPTDLPELISLPHNIPITKTDS